MNIEELPPVLPISKYDHPENETRRDVWTTVELYWIRDYARRCIIAYMGDNAKAHDDPTIPRASL